MVRIKETIPDSEMLYHALVDQASDAFFLHDFNGKLIEVNQKACDSLGYSKDELLKMYVTDIEQDFDLKAAQEQWSEIKPGNSFTLYGHQKRKDGTIFPVEVRFGSAVWNEQKYFLGLVRDITDRQKTESKLAESNKRFSAIFRNSPIPTSLSRLSDGRMAEVNDAWVLITGFSHKEATQKSALELDMIDEDSLEHLSKEYLSKGIIKDEEVAIKIKNGERKSVLISIVPIRIDEEEFVLHMFVDITARLRTEKLLRENEEKYRSFFENSMDAILLTSPDGHIFDANPSALKLFNRENSEIINLTRRDIMDNDDPRLPCLLAEREKKGKTRGELMFLRKDGSKFPAEFSNAVYLDEKGNKKSSLIIRDITERKRTEEALKLSEEKFNKAFHNSPDAVVIIRLSDGKYIDANRIFFELSGYTRDEIIGKNFIFPDVWENPDDRVRFNTLLQKDGIIRDFEARMHSSSAGLRVFLISMEKFILNNDECLLGVFRDITQQKNIQKELEELSKKLEERVKERTLKLEELNKELETFTYSVSHDLKAPLRGIDAFSKLLLESNKTDLDEDARTFLGFIRSNTDKMNQLIDDLLDYSRLERAEIRKEKVRLMDIVSSIVSSYKEDLEKGKFRFEVNLKETEILTDVKGLHIALRNLIDNAIKFSSGKSDPLIRIACEEKPDSWIISVSDNGIGFDMKYKQRIFDIFQRLHRDDEFSGTGLGLAMVKKVMQKMNGRAWASSIPESGSTFYLEMPR